MSLRFERIVFSCLMQLSLLACSHTSNLTKIRYKPFGFEETASRAYQSANSVDYFERKGPYNYRSFKDFKIQLSFRDHIVSDYFVPQKTTYSPLIILQHGNRSFKETHRVQALILASWGFRVLVPQLPNTGQWHENTKTLGDLVSLIRARPKILLGHLSTSKIIGVGHSFGGGVTALTASKNNLYDGIILLDPALFSEKVVSRLKNIKTPVILVGADKKVFRSRRRKQFFSKISSNIVEISIAGAGHWEAQFPSRNQLRWFGLDLGIDKAKQKYFMGALIASAFSLIHQDPLEFAWHIFKNELDEGQLKLAIRK